MSPNRVCGTTDKPDRDRNSPSTEYCSIRGSEIDIVHSQNCQIGSYTALRLDSYCMRWKSTDHIIHGLRWKEERGRKKRQFNVSA